MQRLKKVLMVLRLPIAIVLLILVAVFVFPFSAIGKTFLLASELTPGIFVKPLKLVTKAPIKETVKIKTINGEIEADLYRPADSREHPAAIFTLGIAVTKEDAQVRETSEALARSGFVVLTPDLPDFMSGIIWTDSVESLIASVEYLDKQSFVAKNKIGFAGFCVGSSISIVAAEDPRIAHKVAYISAISPYYDLYDTVEAIITKKASDENGHLIDWKPTNLTIKTFNNGFINYIQDPGERNLLKGYFFEHEGITQEQVSLFSTDAKIIYGILTSSDKDIFDQQMKNLPGGAKELLDNLSPSKKLDRLRAKIFILNDKKDSFIPRSEGEQFEKNLPKNQIKFVKVDSFEHVNPSTKLPRWAAVKGFFQLSVYLYDLLNFAQ